MSKLVKVCLQLGGRGYFKDLYICMLFLFIFFFYVFVFIYLFIYLIPTISTKLQSNVLVIKNTRVNSHVDIQHKLFILACETILPLYVQ